MVLQRFRHVAVTDRQFLNDRPRELGVAFEDRADIFRGDHENSRRGQCPCRHEIGRIAEHGGENKRGHRMNDGQCRFAAVVMGKQFNAAFDHHMEKVGGVSFGDEFHLRREPLQVRRPHDFLEVVLGHPGEQLKLPNHRQIVWSQPAPPHMRQAAS